MPTYQTTLLVTTEAKDRREYMEELQAMANRIEEGGRSTVLEERRDQDNPE